MKLNASSRRCIRSLTGSAQSRNLAGRWSGRPVWWILLTLCAVLPAFAQTPYFTDFESGIGPEWSLSNYETSEPGNFTKFTGRFSNEGQTLTLNSLSLGQSYTVRFDLYVIDSWDGNSGAGDFFTVTVNSNQVFRETFSNYNGDPPSAPQSYPRSPDVGRVPLGFVAAFVDAIYRNIEVSFIATNTTMKITFQGQNLQAISDESWGIDNVDVRLTSTLAATTITSTTLPAAATTNNIALDRFSMATFRDLLGASGTNAANYTLREAGLNGVLGDGDDLFFTLAPSYTSSNRVAFALTSVPLQPGSYRFETKSSLLDANSKPVAIFTRDFVIAHPVNGRIENTGNDVPATATALPMTETPVGSGFFTALGVGAFSAIGDVDYWRFDAEAGDVVTVRVEADAPGIYPQLILQNSSAVNLVQINGDAAGVAQFQTYTFSSPGTYYLRVVSNNGVSGYRMRVDQARSLQLEVEANDSQDTANNLALTSLPGAYQARVAGSVVASDTAGDYFRVGVLNTGNAVNVGLLLPAGSSFNPTNVALSIEFQGNPVAFATNQTGALNFTVVSNGVYYVRVAGTGATGLRAQYLLNVYVIDGVPPLVTSISLPADGSTNTGIIDRITLNFSEEINPSLNRLNRSVSFFGANAYQITDISTTWAAAEAQAASLGGHLVTITSAAENNFVRDTFGSYGNLWIGYTDQGVEGTFAWISGVTPTYTNWNSGQPDNAGGAEDYTTLLPSGLWQDENGVNSHRGVIQVPATDTDGDGIPDAVDAYPNDPLNGFDLRAAGPDNLFGTADDQIYHFESYGYAGGLSVSLRIIDGPLQPGNYRFTVTTAVQDRAGNHLAAPVIRFFTIAAVPGYIVEGRNNDSFSTATSLSPAPTGVPDGSFVVSGYFGVGSNPYFVAAGFLDGDTNLDLVAANFSSDTISVLRGRGDGTFLAPTNFATGNNPIALALGDLNHDGFLDVAVANYSGGSVSILLGRGDGTFLAPTSYSVGPNPRSIKLADFNGDGHLDFVTANASASFVTVALGNGDGTFGPRTNYATGNAAFGVAVADFNGDGKPDLVVANQNSDSVSVLLGTGTGSFAPAVNYPVGSGPRSVDIGDLDGDGKLDLAVVNAYANTVSVLLGTGSGTFGPATNYPTASSDPYQIILSDLNNDGRPDVVVANYSGSRLSVLQNLGAGVLSTPVNYPVSGNPISVVAADFNHDNRIDLATANYGNNTVSLLPGNGTESLAADANIPTLRNGWARGNISSTSDADFWKFTGKAGYQFRVEIDVPGNPGASGLIVEIERPDGTSLGSFASSFTGTGQSGPIVLPVDGAYYIRVTYYYQYSGEYRLRVTTIAPPAQIETEGNDSIGTANVPALTFAVGRQSATVLGSISTGDPGDYYRLGNLASGTEIRLALSQTADSPLIGVMGIYNSAGALITNSLPGATNLLYAVPVAGDGTYYARITASGATTGLASQYLLNIVLADVVPPSITSLDLPAEASTNAPVVDRFTLGFSEDMIASTVLNAGNYELRSAGTDNVFGTADDQIYTISSTGYASGLSASYVVTDGPLQTGSYRFTVTTNLQDRAGNGLVANYVRRFTITAVPGFIFETRNNDSPATATPLSLSPLNTVDGSFFVTSTIGVGANPYFVATGNFNADSHLDLVTANFSSDTISILLGRGDGTFLAATNFATGNNPIAVAVGDINNDGFADVAVANYSAGSVSILLGKGDGTFLAPTNYSVGLNPRSIKLADFNGDGKLDFVTANFSSGNVSVALGNGDGTFGPRTTYATGGGAHGVAIGDFNGDTKLDLVVVNQNSDNATLLLGNGDGTFGAATSITTESGPRSVAVGDVNGDGLLDFVTINSGNNTISVLIGNGNGTFQPRVNYGTGSSDPYHVILADLDASGSLDVVTANYGGNRITQLFNNGNGTFGSPTVYAPGGNPISVAAGDFFDNGRVGIASANYGGNSVSILSPNTSKPLAEDPVGSGIRTSVGRGNLSSTSDVDYWSFTAKAGDSVVIASEIPGNPGASALYYRIDRPDGIIAGDYYAEYTGAGQSGPIFLPVSGTYTLRVNYYYQYFGEYRFRVTQASPPNQIETEGNNAIAQANAINLPLVAGHKTARVLGGIHLTDTGGDYFQLGNLGEGTTVRLGLAKPLSSGLSAVLGIFNSAGSVITNGPAGVTNVSYTIPAGSGGAYFARVISTNNTAGLLSQYLLSIDISDTRPTFVTATSLPSEGGSISSLFDQFNITVNKDLDPVFAGVNRNILVRNGHAYALTTGSATWFGAEAQARAAGGHLVTINDQAENDWLQQNFSGAGNFWIGLSDDAIEGAFVWSSGDPLGFTSWNAGQPDNSGNEDFAAMLSNGRWNDYNGSTVLPGVLEVTGADADGDGIPDTLDVYPGDPLNAFDLRAAGPDGLFNTADDQVYRVTTSAYSSGLTVTFNLVDGPLQPGNYRFTVTSSLRDLFGNSLATAFVRTFTVAGVPGYTLESRTNNAPGLATPLPLVEDPSGVKSAAGRGKLLNPSDVDYWSFTGSTGQVVTLAVDIPGNPGASALYYRINKPDGTILTDLYAAYTGAGLTTPVILPTNGTYTIQVSPYYYYFGEYRLRVSIALPPMQMETEGNDSIAAATPITLVTNASARLGSIAGYIGSSGDLDYYSLGTITNGSSVFLNTRLPSTSGLTPVVSLYNASNVYQNEAPGGRASDGVAQVNITQSGIYYAVVRGANGIGGLGEQYVLDVQVIPTGSVSFPNLQVATVVPPGGSTITSGQPVTLSYTVQNIGSVATPTSTWTDRVVISKNTILGDGDDYELGTFAHNGILNSGGSYTTNVTATLPQGVSGPYYVIVQTDFGNNVNEFVLEGDNVTASATTFNINLAQYPDLKVEGLTVTGPDVANVFTLNWTTANRGTAPANGGFRERILVRNLTVGTVLLNTESAVPASLAVNNTLARSATVTATAPGTYQVQVTTDSTNAFFEYDAGGHVTAEQNTAEAGFIIIQFFNIGVTVINTNGGVATGGGAFTANSLVTVTATPNTNTLPYLFASWTEGGLLQSTNPSYIFTVIRDRQLVANFTLRSFQVTASNNPPAGGSVAGAGNFFYGTTNTLTATPTFGYRFANWTENNAAISINPSLSVVVFSNRFLVANYVGVNQIHEVTTATAPPGLAAVTGSGTYLNGQSAQFTTPPALTNDPAVYRFRRFTLNGTPYLTNASFNKTFVNSDPTNMNFVAEYNVQSLRPFISSVTPGRSNPVPAVTNYTVRLLFDQSMRSTPEPLVTLTNPGSLQPVVPPGGTWSTTAFSNDTYTTPFITFSTGMDGTNRLVVSGAQSADGFILAATNVLNVLVDATFPVISSVTAAPAGFSALITWSTDEPASSQIEFGATIAYGSLTPLNSALLTSHNVTLIGLVPEATYHFRVRSRDLAGNEQLSGDASFLTVPPSDLQVTNLSVTPGVVVSGTQITIQWNDTNSASGATEGSWVDQVILSNLTTSALLLNTAVPYNSALDGNIPAAGFSPRSATFRLPDGPAGVGTFRVFINADALNSVTELNGTATAELNNSASLQFSSSLANYPDLMVLSVTNAASGLPDTLTEVVWVITNRGNATAVAPWTGQILISDDNVIGGDQLLASFVITNSLAAGQSLTITQQVVLPATGVGSQWFVARSDASNDFFELDESNNAGISLTPLQIPATTSLILTRTSFPENSGSNAALVTITRNAGISNAATFTIRSSNTNRVSVPATVFFQALQATTTFRITAVDNALVDGDATASITVAKTGFLTSTNVVTVLDDDAPTLRAFVSVPAIVESAGANAATGMVTRNTATNAPLTVVLASSDPARLTVPALIIIPAGSASALFNIAVINNVAIEPTARITITPSQAGFASQSASIDVLDDDAPPLAITISKPSVSEGAINPAAFLVITRSPVSSNPALVTLQINLGGQILLPNTVIIPANQASVTVPVSVINDRQINGTRVIQIKGIPVDAVRGTLLTASGVATSLQITDDDTSSGLILAVNDVEIPENGSTIATVSRGMAGNQNLLVSLASSIANKAIVPATVTIPKGQVSASFIIMGVPDGAPGSDKRVNITASAPNFSPDVAVINITDIDYPDLQPTNATLAATGLTDDLSPVSWNIANTGFSPAIGTWSDRLYLVKSPADGNPLFVGSVLHANGLGAKAAYTGKAFIRLPSGPGTYFLVIHTDEARLLNEKNQQNNRFISVTSIVVAQTRLAPTLSAYRDVEPGFRLSGRPGASYAIEVRTSLNSGTAWQFLRRAPLTNNPLNISFTTNGSQAFYRAYEFTAEPAVVEDKPGVGPSVSLTVYGTPNLTYQLQSTTNQVGAEVWQIIQTLTLTNSFAIVEDPVTPGPTKRYRVIKIGP